MKIKVLSLILAALMPVLMLVSCTGGDIETTAQTNETTDTTGSNATTNGEETRAGKEPVVREYVAFPKETVLCNDTEKAKYYCPDIFKPTAVPCRVNIKTGQIQYACPTEGCDHSGKDCFYYNKWVRSVYDTGNYLIMIAQDYPAGNSCIFAYEWETGKMTEVSKKAKYIDALIPGVHDGMIYGCHSQYAGGSNISLYGIDLYSTEVSIKQAIRADMTFLFCDGNGDIYGADAFGPVVMYSPKEAPTEYKLPDGCEGFKVRKPGMLYKTDAPAAIYDTESKKTVDPDPVLDITSPVRGGDSYYYQSRGAVEIANTSGGTEAKYVRYDNDIYRQGFDGKAEKFSVNTDYHFIIYAADGDCVIGRLMYKITDGVYYPFEELDHDHIRINIKTKEIQLLDLYTEHAYFS